MNNIVTVIGAFGFLGSNIVSFFKKKNYFVIEINKDTAFDLTINYGIIFYCAGVAVDFQSRVFDTIDAHVMQLRVWLEKIKFDKFIYMSSARMYMGQEDSSEDKDLYIINKNDIYNQTKMMGELVCLSSKRPVVILRVSNVVGYDENSPYFLWSIFREAKLKQNITVQESSISVRDYVLLADFLFLLQKITVCSIEGIYNVASSVNINHLKLASIVNKHCVCKWTYGEKTVTYPIICNEKIKKDLFFHFSDPHEFIDNLFHQYTIGRENNDN